MTAPDVATLAAPLLLPFSILLAVIVISRRLATDMRPVFVNIITGVAEGAKSNAQAYGIAVLFGLTASISSFIDVFHNLDSQQISSMSWHQYAVLWAKVANPFIVAILAYAMKNDFRGGGIGGDATAKTVAIPLPLKSP